MHTPSLSRRVRRVAPLAALAAALTLGACSDDDDRDFDAEAEARAEEQAANAPATVAFDPANGVLPFPNDVLFAGSEDGTLNAPVADPDDPSDPAVALNLMDGFSTTQPITLGVSAALDPASLRIGETVRVFEYTGAEDGAVTLGRELGATELVAAERDGTLAIVPTRPLAAATRHAVYVTTGVTDTRGRPLRTPSAYGFVRGATPLSADNAALVGFNESLPLLEPLRQATRPLIEAIGAAEQPVAVQDVAMAWSVTTQGIREVLQSAFDSATPQTLVVAPSGVDTSATMGLGKADVYVGSLELPYYQIAPDSPETVPLALNSSWRDAGGNPVTRFSPAANARGVQTVPVLMSVPNANAMGGGTAPETGWPVAIYQHGVTRNRLDMLAVADALADAGFVTVAIDAPLHGITDPTNPFHADNTPLGERERHFGLDLVNNETGASGPDGQTDPSGDYFFNLANLVNFRDNLRQSVADLMALSASVATAGGVPLDATAKAFVGHSFGGIIGTTLLSYDTSFTSGTLGMAGGDIMAILSSGAFSERLNAGLGAAGVTPGSPEYAQFLLVAQTLADSGDAINHAPFHPEDGAPLHLIEVIGDGTVPNAVFGSPLAGTEPLAALLGAMPLAESGAPDPHALVRFGAGDHGSLIGSPASREATVEMQRQTALFAASRGTLVDIADASVVAPLDAEVVVVGAPGSGDGGTGGDTGGDGGETDGGTGGDTSGETGGTTDGGTEGGADGGTGGSTDGTATGGTDGGADTGGTDGTTSGGTDGGTDTGADGGSDA